MRYIVRGSRIEIALAAMLSLGVAHAMEIKKFDKTSDRDQDEYVADLTLGAQRVLREEGHSDLAEQVHKLVTEKDPEANVSTGMMQFDLSLAKARVTDLERDRKRSESDTARSRTCNDCTFKKERHQSSEKLYVRDERLQAQAPAEAISKRHRS